MTYREKVTLLRRRMSEEELDAYIVYAFDPHRSIAVADHWKTVQWLTGFTGWVCTLVVTGDREAFWTDGRYVEQAMREIDCEEMEHYCISNPEHPSYFEWLAAEISDGAALGLNGRVVATAEFEKLDKQLRRENIGIRPDVDLIGDIWSDRPGIPMNPLFALDLKYSGKSREDKLAEVRRRMSLLGADYHIMSDLGDIAWLTNLRGADSPLYPIFHSFMLVGRDCATLFTIPEKIPKAIVPELSKAGIGVGGMEDIYASVRDIPAGSAIYYDPYKTCFSIASSIPEGVHVVNGMDIATGIKCCKNEIEQENVKRANVLESVNVIRLIKHLKENVGKLEMNEFYVGQWIMSERRKHPEFLKAANVPIVGYRGNAVQLHYRPAKEGSDLLEAEGMLLFDLCAHYLIGSTDITRTIALGPITDQMKHDYTFTLKSHIRLATQKVLYGTTGPELDAVVKCSHWNEGMTYGAGTGHGMGYCLYIQEGPCKIATDPSPYFNYMYEAPIEPGMLFSNEPGVYRAGSHAIRIENTILAKEGFSNEYGRFLEFETITFMPLELEAVVPEMLTADERDWVNWYHGKTFELALPFLTREEREWLKTQIHEI